MLKKLLTILIAYSALTLLLAACDLTGTTSNPGSSNGAQQYEVHMSDSDFVHMNLTITVK